nr:RagB/SusD family nutrient uptake outer membrane protein [uncultured Carboxylicivirga sp.]
MKINKIKYLALLMLLMSLTSCEKFFDLKPGDSTPDEDIIENERDAQNILNGFYSGLKSSAMYGRYLTILGDLMTDASLAASGFSNQMGEMYSWRYNPGSSDVASVWGAHYSNLYNCNFLINNLHTIEGDSANINRMMGEALTGRALLHHNLVRLYGEAYQPGMSESALGVPYVTWNDVREPSRNTVVEVYDYLVEDIEEAIELLPNEKENQSTSLTKSFAYGLRARIALDMQDYETAAEYASKVIDNSLYSLTSGASFTNMWKEDEGNEIIFRVGYTISDPGAAVGYNFFNRESFDQYPSPDYIPADSWIDSYESDRDIRKETYITYSQTRYGWAGNLVYKYPTATGYVQQGMNMPKPMRLAEMYLIRAEANAYLGNADDARDDLQELIETRISGYTIDNELDGNNLISFIENERKRELMFEGFNWFDLKRKGKGFARIPQENTTLANDLVVNADNHRWIWPIPTVEMNGNSNMEQNPGY